MYRKNLREKEWARDRKEKRQNETVRKNVQNIYSSE